MATIRDEISKNLLYYRKKLGYTQKELAEKLGVKNTSVSNWESGYNSIDIETLYRVCGIFGVSVNDMYGVFSVSPAPLSDAETYLLDSFRELNEEGREKVTSYVSDLLRTGIYKKDDQSCVVSQDA